MAKTFKLPPQDYVVLDSNDKEVLRTSLLDLYYTIVHAVDEAPGECITQPQKMAHAASIINSMHGTQFTWGDLTELFVDISEEVESVKKNTTS